MTLRITLGFSLLTALAGARAFAQPATAPSSIATEDTLEKELDKLLTSGGLTADQAAARAIQASPAVQRRNAEIEIAIAQVETAELARVPRLSAEVRYARLSPVDAVNLGGFTIPVFLNSTTVSATLGVPLSDYVLRFPYAIGAAKLGEQAARVGRHATALGAAQDARLAYYEWARAKLQVLVAQRALEQVRATVKQFLSLVEAQRVAKVELLRVQSQEAVAERTRDQLQYLATLREEQLRLLIGAGPEEQLAIGEDLRRPIAVPPDGTGKLDDLMRTANAQRLEFKSIQIGLAAKAQERKANKANLYPSLSAFAGADYDNPNQRIFPQVDAFRSSWQIGARLSWSLNDMLVARATDRRIFAESEALRADRENLERGTRIEVLGAQQAVVLADAGLATSQKGLVAAVESYRVRRELLAADRATALDLVDAEQDLTRARIAAVNAQVDLRVAIVQLFHALGNDTK